MLPLDLTWSFTAGVVVPIPVWAKLANEISRLKK
jgi:hypothetical protein